jgi:hypothetical protein
MKPKTYSIILVTSLIILLLPVLWLRPANPSYASWPMGEFTPSDFSYLPLVLNEPLITPTPTQSVPPAPLDYINAYRAMADLPPVTENTDWSIGDWLHSRYMVKNDVIEHTEDPGNPWYTPEGLEAAQSSNLVVSSSDSFSDEAAIDGWMVAPFHAIGILDPALLVIGYGSYREADGGWQTGAGLDVIRGLGSIPPSVTFPILWPGDGQIIALTSFPGNELPNPLTSCPGYTAPAGLPIYIQIGDGSQTPSVTASTFSQGATPLEHCTFDETNYANPDSDLQNLGQLILDGRDAIVFLPRNPLTPGVSYTVSITVNGETYTWTFTVSTLVKPAFNSWIR